jgi:hypothetical protein
MRYMDTRERCLSPFISNAFNPRVNTPILMPLYWQPEVDAVPTHKLNALPIPRKPIYTIFHSEYNIHLLCHSPQELFASPLQQLREPRFINRPQPFACRPASPHAASRCPHASIPPLAGSRALLKTLACQATATHGISTPAPQDDCKETSDQYQTFPQVT